MKKLVSLQSSVCVLALLACLGCFREKSVPGSPVPFEPSGVENYRLDEGFENGVNTSTSRSSYLLNRWKAIGIVIPQNLSPLEEAIILANIEGLSKALPGTKVVRLPNHWRMDDPLISQPLDVIFKIEVKDIAWNAPDKKQQNLKVSLHMEYLGFPFDNVHYGTPPTESKVKPDVNLKYNAEAQGVIRSDTLLNKVRDSFAKEMEKQAGKWFEEDAENAPQENGIIVSATGTGKSGTDIPDLLSDFPLPDGCRLLASGEGWDRMMDRTAYALFELSALPQDASKVVLELLEGRTFDPERYWLGSLEGWIHWTVTEPGSNHEPYVKNPPKSPAVNVYLPGYVTGNTPAPADATSTPLLLTAKQTSSSTDLAEMAEKALAVPVSEVDALLAYRLQAWPQYGDLARRLYQRAADAYPGNYMIHRVYADFLMYEVKDPVAALKQLERTRQALHYYNLKEPGKVQEALDKMQQELEAQMAAEIPNATPAGG